MNRLDARQIDGALVFVVMRKDLPALTTELEQAREELAQVRGELETANKLLYADPSAYGQYHRDLLQLRADLAAAQERAEKAAMAAKMYRGKANAAEDLFQMEKRKHEATSAQWGKTDRELEQAESDRDAARREAEGLRERLEAIRAGAESNRGRCMDCDSIAQIAVAALSAPATPDSKEAADATE